MTEGDEQDNPVPEAEPLNGDNFKKDDKHIHQTMTEDDEQNNPAPEAEPLNEAVPLNEDSFKKNDKERKSCMGPCANFWKNVTVEPCAFLFISSVMLMVNASQNLYLEKACRVNLKYSDEICDALRAQSGVGQSEAEKIVQQHVTAAMAWKTYITATIPCVLALLVGSWSDKTGYRKFFIIYSAVGQALACLNCMLHTYFYYETTLELLVLSEAILEGFSGGWSVCFLTLFAYISTITTETDRTFRMGLLNFAQSVAFPVGMGLSGVILKKGGFYATYGTALVLQIINFSYTAFMLLDPEKTAEQKKNGYKGICYFLKTFFDFSNIKQSLILVFRKGSGNRRARLCVSLIVVSLLFGPMFGEISILYMSTRYRFNWDELNFSIYQTYNFVIHTIGTLFAISVLSKYLHWHDSLLGLLSATSKIAAAFIYAFAQSPEIFYIGPIVEVLSGTALLAMRSIVSKLVETDELGKVNSVFNLTENLMPLLYVPMYTKIYNNTMDTLPGAVFLVGAALYVPTVVVFSWFLADHRKQQRRLKETEKTKLNGIEMT